LELPGRWDADMIDYRVELLLQDQRRGDDPEDFYRAAVAALASGEEVYDFGSKSGEYRCEEGAAREALTGIVRRLDALRPWPPPPFVLLDAERWEELGGAPVIGRVTKPVEDVALAFHLSNWVGRDAGRVALGVRMLSGRPVALCDVGDRDAPLVDLRSPGEPAGVRAEITAATGLTIDPP
jgi:hypothetical protein